MTVPELKIKAEKMALQWGHELGVWKLNKDHWLGHHSYCKLCHDYAYINKCFIEGTAIDTRPVRSGGDIIQKKYRCSGNKDRGHERRTYTRKKSAIIDSFSKGGLKGVIFETIGKYPI